MGEAFAPPPAAGGGALNQVHSLAIASVADVAVLAVDFSATGSSTGVALLSALKKGFTTIRIGEKTSGQRGHLALETGGIVSAQR